MNKTTLAMSILAINACMIPVHVYAEDQKNNSTVEQSVEQFIEKTTNLSSVFDEDIMSVNIAELVPIENSIYMDSTEKNEQPSWKQTRLPLLTGEEYLARRSKNVDIKNINSSISGSIPQVSSEIKAMSASRIGGDSAPQSPASLEAMARALQYNVDYIYQYVKNNIEYTPGFEGNRGALGTLLDKQGNAFDQAQLMVYLLRYSGYEVKYISGWMTLNAQQMEDWFGYKLANTCSLVNFLSSTQIPVNKINGVTPNATIACGSPATLTSAQIAHIWVKVKIGNEYFVFDPSFKTYNKVNGINLKTETGYDASTFLSNAKSGAIVTADYVQNLNRTNIRNNLTTYSNNLINYLRQNKPTATLDDVLGGKQLKPITLMPRDTSFSTASPARVEEHTAENLGEGDQSVLQIKYQGIDQSFTSEFIYGKRLTITFNGSNKPELRLDGQIYGSPGTAVAAGTTTDLTINIIHNRNSALNETFVTKIKPGGTYAIANSWGYSSRGLVSSLRSQLEKAIGSGSTDVTEQVSGTTLALIGADWLSQTSASAYMIAKLNKSYVMPYHQVGIVGYYNNLTYVDLPANRFVIGSAASTTAEMTKDGYRNMSSLSRVASILESTTVQQVTKTPAASTMQQLDAAIAAGQKVYKTNNLNNFANSIAGNLTNCTVSHISNYASLISGGYTLLIPQSCKQTLGLWSGNAYLGYKLNNELGQWSAKIDTFSGGVSGYDLPMILPPTTFEGNIIGSALALITITATQDQSSLWNRFTDSVTGLLHSFADPIDIVKGNFILDHTDLNVGSGSFPASLDFTRSYTSSQRVNDSALGRGWTHNLDKYLYVNSDGLQSMGEDSALDASAVLTALTVLTDLDQDTTFPVDKDAIKAVITQWLSEQLVDNTVVVQDGVNGHVFVKLTDGTYNSPPANSSKLIRNSNGTYTLDTVNHAKYQYNAPTGTAVTKGKITTYTEPSGLQIKFNYDSAGKLTSVANSLGHSLNLTYSDNRISKVTDGSRTVNYIYDTAKGNLTGFKNTLGQQTTYQYDLPGRITKVFDPGFPGNAKVTNVYDSLDRVFEQTNALGQKFEYGFGGSRSFEIGPEITKQDGTKEQQLHVLYFDALGNITQEKDPLDYWQQRFYDGLGRVVKELQPQGNGVEYTYDDASCKSSEKRCTHNIKTVKLIPKVDSAAAAITARTMTYDTVTNKIASSTDAKGSTTNYSYNSNGTLNKVLHPADSANVRPETTYSYINYTPSGFPALSLPSAVTSKINSTTSTITSTTYNTGNKYVPATTVVDSGTGKLNLKTTYTYDSIGNLTKVDGPRTDVTDTVTTVYNTERLVTQTSNALGKVTKNFYDADNRVIRTAQQQGTQWLVSCNTYSKSGKVTRIVGPVLQSADSSCPAAASPNRVVDITYDEVDRQSKVTEYPNTTTAQNRTTQTYYQLDNKVKVIRKNVGGSLDQNYAQYAYTPNGKLWWSVDAAYNGIRYIHDDFDRIQEIAYPVTTVGIANVNPNDTETFKYDNNGNVTQHKKRSGALVNHSYDKLNRLISSSYPTETASNMSYGYDLLNHRTQSKLVNGSNTVDYVYDNVGRLTSTSSGGKTIGYQYDAASNRTRITWPETAFYVTTSYDALNRPLDIKETGSVNLASYAYDDLSRRTTVTLGNGTTTTSTYNNQNQLATLSHGLAGTAQDIQYTYTRNRLGEITTENWNNDVYQWAGTAAATTNYVSNGLNQYTTVGGKAQSYDTNGNLKTDGTGWTYGYDLNNRLKTAVKTGTGALTANLNYDAEGRLRQTVVGSATTNLAYDGTDLVAEYNGTTLARRYVHGPGVDEPLVWYEGSGTANKNWIYSNHLGSVIALANTTGTSTATYTYGPYGEPNTTAGNMRFRYTGQTLLTPLGLYYYKARIYSPTLGRFLQVDPIGTADDMNLYAYVGNNPINANDSSGLYASQLAGRFVGNLSGVSYSWSGLGQSAGRGAVTGGIRGAVVGTVGGPGWGNAVGGATGALGGVVVGTGAYIGTPIFEAGLNAIFNSKDTLSPGPHAGDSIPARGPDRDFTQEERDKINEIGANTGCHTCGTKDAGTKTGNFIPDHQPPNALNPSNAPQQLYPHCIGCSRTQGGQIRGGQTRK